MFSMFSLLHILFFTEKLTSTEIFRYITVIFKKSGRTQHMSYQNGE